MKCIILILFLLSVNSLVFGSSDNLDVPVQYDVNQDQSDNSNELNVFETESMIVEEGFFQIHEDEVLPQEEIIIVGTFGGGGIFQSQDSLENRPIVDSESKNPFEEVLMDESENNTIESYFQKDPTNNNGENDFIVGTFGGGGLRLQQPFIENEVGTLTEDKTIYEYFNNEVRKNQEIHNHDFNSTRNTHYIHRSPYFPRIQDSQVVPLITGTFGGGGMLQFSTVSSENDNNIFSNPNIGIFYRTEVQSQQETPYRSFENLNFNAHPSYGKDVHGIVGTFGSGVY